MDKNRSDTAESSDYLYDVAATLWQGRRAYQEDAIEHRFADEPDFGYVVLADGMGGHDAGDVASRLAIQSVSNVLQADIAEHNGFCDDMEMLLSRSVNAANSAIAEETGSASGTARMGTTLVTVLLCSNQLYWTSVGDSPLFLWRDGRLSLLNEDHSMAPVIDQMVINGELSADAAKNHPDRNALTSAITGERLNKVDLSPDGFALRPGDFLMVASDGIQYLDDDVIAAVLTRTGTQASSEQVCDALIAALQELNHPHQDNVSICGIRVLAREAGQDAYEFPDVINTVTRPLDEQVNAARSKPKRRWLASFRREALPGRGKRSGHLA